MSLNESRQRGSSPDLLMSAARQSMANVEKSIQASSDPEHEAELEAAKKDEIINLKASLALRDLEIEKQKLAFESLTADSTAAQCELNARIAKLDALLQSETVKRIGFEDQAKASEAIVAKMTLGIATFQSDLERNWITRSEHDLIVHKFESDIKSKEAEIVEIRSQFDDVRKSKTDENTTSSSAANVEANSGSANSLTSPSAAAIDQTACNMCPTYQAEIAKLKKKRRKTMKVIKFNTKILNEARINLENQKARKNAPQD